MKVLIACEYSGRVRNAFARRGHTAVSVDLLSSDSEGWHYRGNVLTFLKEYPQWDLMIAFPPCTHLSGVGAGTWKEKERTGQQEEAMHFFLDLWEQKQISRIAIENPQGKMSTWWRKPDQYIDPWQFGDPWFKRTGLWLKGLPLLQPSKPVTPLGHWVDGGTMMYRGLSKPLHEGSYMLTKAKGITTTNPKAIAHERAKTFKGVARAMANQWG